MEMGQNPKSAPNLNQEDKAKLMCKQKIFNNLFFSKSVISGRSVVSRRTVISANGSIKTSKTYISTLEKQLNEERFAREKLEKEIEEIKKINSEISSKLGLSIK